MLTNRREYTLKTGLDSIQLLGMEPATRAYAVLIWLRLLVFNHENSKICQQLV